MKWKDLKIRSKIGFGFIIIIGLSVVVSVILLINLNRVNTEIKQLSDIYIPSVYEGSKVLRFWQETSESARSYDFTGDDYFSSREGVSFSRLSDALSKLMVFMAGHEDQLEAKGVSLAVLKQYVDNYKVSREEYLEIAERYNSARGVLEDQFERLTQESYSGYNEVKIISQVNGIVALMFINDKERDGVKFKELKDDIARLKNSIQTGGFSGGLQTNLNDLVDNLNICADIYQSMRIKELKNFEDAKNVLWEVRASSDLGLDQIMVMGERSIKIVDGQKNILITSLILILVGGFLIIYILTNAISRPIVNGIMLAEQVASGDLSVKLAIDRKDEVGRLANALNNMVANLRKVVDDIASSANHIVKSSSKLNTEAMELSEGATQQASAAEEVSSSMEEMHANIQQNTENSKITESIATKAAEGISVSNNKSKIASEHLQEITGKISVIKDIAFQTNILALNAAVEAARAGQEGRGFAVVASEVRKLAERSQIAAQEITKVSTVTTESSKEAADLLDSITPEIAKTATLVQEITMASLEQVSGVEQINNALQQLNQVTQRNAANAEEISTAAKDLDVLSKKLLKAISVFHIGGESYNKMNEGDLQKKGNYPNKGQIEVSGCEISNEYNKNEGNIKIDLGKEYDDDTYERF
ncbi:MAG: methyl-accepting chemotaxis protein [Marinilabiliaceae bacterium]|nr:methyl-accepting chemotaxis protein [Marinilabiliaceae bacterium]